MVENLQLVPQKRVIPLTQWNKFHPWPPMGGLRHLVFHENENGFSSCVIRCGNRVLIDEAKFFQWLESQGQDSSTSTKTKKTKNKKPRFA